MTKFSTMLMEETQLVVDKNGKYMITSGCIMENALAAWIKMVKYMITSGCIMENASAVDKDGKIYDSGRVHYGNCIGRVDKDGKVYDSWRVHYGNCIGRVEGPNILSAGAAYLLL